MRLLNGRELADFIKVRQAKSVRNLVQEHKIHPKLLIIRTNPDPVVDSYMRLKQHYGDDIGVEVEVATIDQAEALNRIEVANSDNSIHGVIVQIPLPDTSQTDEVLSSVNVNKDVDGLAPNSRFDPATPIAINWLLAGYNIQLKGKDIVIVGQGRLVGDPLRRMWNDSGLKIRVANSKTANLSQFTKNADVVVTATGRPGLITEAMLKPNVVLVDAGVSTDSNGLVGDVAPEVRKMSNITITPEKGGVGPLTVSALFENVIKSARHTLGRKNEQ